MQGLPNFAGLGGICFFQLTNSALNPTWGQTLQIPGIRALGSSGAMHPAAPGLASCPRHCGRSTSIPAQRRKPCARALSTRPRSSIPCARLSTLWKKANPNNGPVFSLEFAAPAQSAARPWLAARAHPPVPPRPQPESWLRPQTVTQGHCHPRNAALSCSAQIFGTAHFPCWARIPAGSAPRSAAD